MNTKVIVAAVDGSDSALEAVRAADQLAGATGRKLQLLYVHPDYATSDTGFEILGKERVERLKQQSARAAFDSAHALLGKRSPPPGEILLWGDPAEEIISYMENNPGVHLVMGRRGLSKLKSLVLGSVSEKVVRHAPGLVTVTG